MKRESPTSQRKVRSKQRALQALAMRSQGATYTQISGEMKISTSTAWALVRDALAELKLQVHEEAEHVREQMLIRLDAGLAAIRDAIEAGDCRAIATMIALDERRAKLLGIDAPQKHEMIGLQAVLVIPSDGSEPPTT